MIYLADEIFQILFCVRVYVLVGGLWGRNWVRHTASYVRRVHTYCQKLTHTLRGAPKREVGKGSAEKVIYGRITVKERKKTRWVGGNCGERAVWLKR